MDSNWAGEHLQVIRTLMERSAIYRRTLAPIMLLLGILGLLAAAGGWFLGLESGRAFVLYWTAISLVGLCGAYLLVRRQSLKDAEPFWSPPTRRVTQALLPPLFAGFIAGILAVFPAAREALYIWWLPPLWMVLYGCALHAAGFFMPRGMKLFGWGFIVSGGALAGCLSCADGVYPLLYAHIVMGISFGGFHLAYGLYLYFTENRKNEA
ncbi:MAG: hypothetical protein HY674_21730 [Chloroflexi bacterium]|nr:hypothetical protein [Chloroflexota bacterium]